MIEIDFSIMWVVFGIVIGVLGGASVLVFLYFWGDTFRSLNSHARVQGYR